jgi:MFS family permease
MTAALNDTNPWPPFATLLIGTLITVEAAAFQTPALPTIARYFNVDADVTSLVILLYYLALVSCSPVFGRVADSFGRKRVVVAGMSLFVITEAAAACAPSFAFLLTARFGQGIAVACILPILLSYVNYLFPQERRGKPLGIMVATMSLGAATGGVIGGLLIDDFGWRSIYAVSAGVASIGLALIIWRIPATPDSRVPYHPDANGALLLMLTVGSLLLLPTLISRFGLVSVATIVVIAVALSAAALLWKVETKTRLPVIQVSLLRNKGFILPALIYFLFLICHGATVYSLAFYIGNRPGGSASQIGLVTMVSYTGSVLGALISGRLIDQFNERAIIFLAIAMMGSGVLCYGAVELATPLAVVASIVALLGFCQGMKGPAVTKIALNAIGDRYTNSGSGLFTMFRDFGTPAGVAIALALFTYIRNRVTQETLHATAREGGLDPVHADALVGAMSASPGDYPELMLALNNRGMEFAQLLNDARLAGLSSVLEYISWCLMALLVAALILALQLPKAPGASNISERTS